MTSTIDTRLQIEPLSGWTGALISGVDLSNPLSESQTAQIREALLQWKVVFFRDQQLGHAQQIAFGKQFGEVTPGHPYEGDTAPEGFPEIHTVPPKAYSERYGEKYRKRQGANGPGVSPHESRRLLGLLYEELARPEYTVRFKWEPGSIAFWDNRATVHLAPQDLTLDHDRRLYRITLVGDVPKGPDGRESVALDGEPFDAV